MLELEEVPHRTALQKSVTSLHRQEKTTKLLRETLGITSIIPNRSWYIIIAISMASQF